MDYLGFLYEEKAFSYRLSHATQLASLQPDYWTRTKAIQTEFLVIQKLVYWGGLFGLLCLSLAFYWLSLPPTSAIYIERRDNQSVGYFIGSGI